jgi:DNA helicase-2/ATP-dependent DNA helicase PcrA
MQMNVSIELNDKQREAVEATEGPVLVIAGAGSGKTRVLTERIAHLVRNKNVRPEHILAFTFTNRAAREMKERLERGIPGIAARLWVGTFHATGVRILRTRGEAIGIDRYFSIYDANDSLEVVKDVIARRPVEGHLLRSPRSVRDSISRWKNDLITPEMAVAEVSNHIEKRVAAVYAEYEKSLRRAKALDFDDLIAKVVELFAVHPDVREYYARRFQYVLVDEFQDTNPIQMAMIDGLASHHRNLFVVGDDDQSIYSWRGAKVEHILSFEEIYPGTQIVRLEQNYRSSQTILDAANQVIANNVGRKGKNLWTDGDRGEKVNLIVSMDEESEAMNVLHAVTELVGSGVALRDIAVLYRTNAQSRALEDVLKLGSTPYQIIGSVRFYERAEIRDLLAYCKLIANPADSVSLKRIINVPRRGLGKTTFERLTDEADLRNVTVIDVLKSGSYPFAGAPMKRCVEFVKLFAKLEAVAEEKDAPAVIEAIIDETGYRKHLTDNYPDGDSRIENAEELVAAAEVYTELTEDRSLRSFLQEIALVADIDTFDDTVGQLTLMTLHNAKGLEFDCILITGLEDGLFPHFNSLDNPDAIEEERRLFYVGMTRARKRLYCSYAHMRRRMGVIEGGQPSRFLYELPDECIEGTLEEDVSISGIDDSPGQYQQLPFATTGAWSKQQAARPQREFEDYSQEELVYSVGMRIKHDAFGKGVVRKVEGAGESLRVTVIFDGGGERKFLAHYAPMHPL